MNERLKPILKPHGLAQKLGRESLTLRPRHERPRARHLIPVFRKLVLFPVAVKSVTLLFLVVSSAFAAESRNVTLQLTRTNGTAQVSWTARSAVPLPGRQIVPDFQLERSSDLTNWSNIGTRFTGAINNQNVKLLDAAGGEAAFYRVKSIVDRPFGDFIADDLRAGEFADANFFGAEFFNARLDNAVLTGADLRGSDLRFVTFTDARLDGADLFAADLLLAVVDFVSIENADVSFANLEGADLFGSSLLGSDLRSTILTDADLRFATLHNTLIDSQTMLPEKWMRVWRFVNDQATNTVFTNLDLSLADLRSANLNGMTFAGSDFSGNDLGGADVRGANFTNVNLRFVTWQAAQMDTNTIIEPRSRLTWEIVNEGAVNRHLGATNLSNMLLTRADMRGVNLTNANLNLAVLDFANLGGANLRGATLSSNSLFRATLTNANLSFANFFRADLTEANMFGATTNGAIFTGATFSQTIMPDGSVRNP